MKTTLNSRLNRTFTALTLVACMSLTWNTHAQTLVTPSNADQVQYNTGSASLINFMNASAIAFISGGSPGYIFATATWDGTNAYIYVTDPALNQTIAIPSTGTMACTPDIIIGNHNNAVGYNPATDYIVGVSFVNSSGDVEVDYYEIYDDHSTTLSYTGNLGSSTRSPSTGPVATNSAHMDIVADYTNTGTTGLAWCNEYVVTWAEMNSGNPNIYAAAGNLNTQTLGTTRQINNSGSSIHGIQPDVAALKRMVGLGSAITAYITYVDAFGSTQLYLTEYDFSSPGAIGTNPIVLDDGTHNSNGAIIEPRIDAFDNYTTVGSPAHYTVVATVNSSITSRSEIRNYDNNLNVGASPYYYEASQFVDVSGLGFPWSSFSPPYNHSFPVVSASGANYNVFHSTQLGSNYAYFAEPIDVFTSALNTTPNQYFWVNSDGAPLMTLSMPNTLAVCSPPNLPQLQTVYAWGKFNGVDCEMDYKIPSGYSFKATPPTVKENKAVIQPYPNPAKDVLYISNPSAPMSATSFEIADATGKIKLHGSMQPGTMPIDISSLATGVYVMRILRNGTAYGNEVFLKN